MNSEVSISHPLLGLIIQSFINPSYFPSHASPYAFSLESLIAHDGVPTMSSSSYLWLHLSKHILNRQPGFFNKLNYFEDILVLHERREEHYKIFFFPYKLSLKKFNFRFNRFLSLRISGADGVYLRFHQTKTPFPQFQLCINASF